MTQSTVRWKRPGLEALLLTLITLLAFALRLYHLDFKGFWGDEIWTAQVAAMPAAQLAEQSVPLMLSNFIPGPLYYWLGHGALAILGQTSTEFALRLPSAMASALAVPALYGLARALAGSRVGLIAALLLAVSPYQVWYAQEARFYAWTVLLALLATWALLRALQAPQRYGAWSAFVAATAASLYNQPIPALAVLLAQGIFVALMLVRHRQRGLLLAAAGLSCAAIVLLYTPVAREVLAAGYFSSQPQSVAVAQKSFFSPSLVDWSGRAVYILTDISTRFAAAGAGRWLFLALAIAGLGYFMWARRLAALALTLSFVLAALFVFAIARPATGYIARYVLFLQPIYLLCVAAGVACLIDALRGHTLSQGIVAGGVLALLVALSLLTVGQGYREAKLNDWRAIARYLDHHAQPGDIITGNRWFDGALSWYWYDRTDFAHCSDSQPLLLEEAAAGRRVWYVLIGESDSPASALLAAALRPVPVETWGQPGLDYSPTFFPVSEFAVNLLAGGSGANASVQFCEIPEPNWTDRSYRNVEVGETVRFQVTLPAASRRSLELTYFDHPAKPLAVQIDNQPSVTIGGGEGGWQTARLPVLSENAAVVVAVTGVGVEGGGVSAARLTVD